MPTLRVACTHRLASRREGGRRLHGDVVVLGVFDLPVTIPERASLEVVEPDLGPERDRGGRVHRGEVAVDPSEFCGELRLDVLGVEGRLVTAGRELDGDDQRGVVATAGPRCRRSGW
jgi:hypothetical protein